MGGLFTLGGVSSRRYGLEWEQWSTLSSGGFGIPHQCFVLTRARGALLLWLVLVLWMQEQAHSTWRCGQQLATLVMREESSPRGNSEKPLSLAKSSGLFVQLSRFTSDWWKAFLLYRKAAVANKY